VVALKSAISRLPFGFVLPTAATLPASVGAPGSEGSGVPLAE